MDRVQPSEGWGRTFESCLAHHLQESSHTCHTCICAGHFDQSACHFKILRPIFIAILILQKAYCNTQVIIILMRWEFNDAKNQIVTIHLIDAISECRFYSIAKYRWNCEISLIKLNFSGIAPINTISLDPQKNCGSPTGRQSTGIGERYEY